MNVDLSPEDLGVLNRALDARSRGLSKTRRKVRENSDVPGLDKTLDKEYEHVHELWSRLDRLAEAAPVEAVFKP